MVWWVDENPAPKRSGANFIVDKIDEFFSTVLNLFWSIIFKKRRNHSIWLRNRNNNSDWEKMTCVAHLKGGIFKNSKTEDVKNSESMESIKKGFKKAGMKRFTTTLNKWEKAIHYMKLYLTGSNKTEKSKIDKMDFERFHYPIILYFLFILYLHLWLVRLVLAFIFSNRIFLNKSFEFFANFMIKEYLIA